jgi:hypothetical protein
MIYSWVYTVRDARECIVDFYEDVLRDEIDCEHTTTTPEAYLIEVLAQAKDQVDNNGNEIEHLIRKACAQTSTLKKLKTLYAYANRDPEDYMEMYS